ADRDHIDELRIARSPKRDLYITTKQGGAIPHRRAHRPGRMRGARGWANVGAWTTIWTRGSPPTS
ncbi:hypothetical protein JTP67_36980, partial [Streptomyces sp. S12]|nr:hypothetical protein [Streptomyces sp. S12]